MGRSKPRPTSRRVVTHRKIFHGRAGQLYQRYQDGMEDQIGVLGLVLNALVLFNTRYMDAAVTQLRADGFNVRDEDVTRLSPFVRHHINIYLDEFAYAGPAQLQMPLIETGSDTYRLQVTEPSVGTTGRGQTGPLVLVQFGRDAPRSRT
ncbi:Tn3 family transposase [Streptomyces sp. NPDC005202]|uniref:Tn3 family transposase n=1 Tax=Streptomyces sp. NPDC005202 TaxID=3157021 RepID=UPI0033A14C0E